MNDDTKIMPRDPGSNGSVELLSSPSRFPHMDLSPREPHLYDYLLILRKHQWLILSFLLAVVTIVSIATFRMRSVYIATARIEIDRENANILPFQGADAYDYMMDLDNYIETQSKILTSETLALQTIRNSGLASTPEFFGGSGPSEAIATGSLANQKYPPEVGAFLGSLSAKRVPNTRLMDVSFESTDRNLPRAWSMPIWTLTSSRITAEAMKPHRMHRLGLPASSTNSRSRSKDPKTPALSTSARIRSGPSTTSRP